MGALALSRFRAALAEVAAGAPRAIAGRLSRLTTAGKKAKTHTFFLVAGIYGAYAVLCAGLDRGVEEAMLRLIHACSSLWDKVQDRRKVEQLRLEVVEAISHVELRLSATELDIKLHNLMHLVDGIINLGGCSVAWRETHPATAETRHTFGWVMSCFCLLCMIRFRLNNVVRHCLCVCPLSGPLYTHAMFKPESLWGSLGRWAHSKRHMEASMFFTALDKEVTHYIKRHAQPGLVATSRRGGEVAVLEETGAGALEGAGDDEEQAHGDTELSLWQEEAFFTTDPTIFWGRPAGMRSLSTAEFQGIEALYSRAGLMCALAGKKDVQVVKEVWVEKLKISARAWFLCRPGGDGGNLWFGQVQEVMRHCGGDGEVRALVKANWHTQPKWPRRSQVPAGLTLPFDAQLRCPVISPTPVVSRDGPWYLPESIVPWPCMAVQHPRYRQVMVVLARHWHVLRNLHGYPVPR